jgi:hypothetical protein
MTTSTSPASSLSRHVRIAVLASSSSNSVRVAYDTCPFCPADRDRLLPHVAPLYAPRFPISWDT